jgi:magnesium transporter
VALEEAGWTVEEIETDQDLREAAFGPKLVWIRATGSTPAEFDHLGKLFDLHPLALEDVQSASQRPKVEDYPNMTFVVVRLPARDGSDIRWVQVGLFLGKDFVLTASNERTEIMDGVEGRLVAGGMLREVRTADTLLHMILDGLVDSYFPFLHTLEDDIEELEEAVLEKAGKQELAKIRDLKGAISRTRRVAVPMREAMLNLERTDRPLISRETRTYLRNVADHMIRISEQVEHVKEVALITQEAWNSAVANQQNQAMKRLTVVAAVLLIPALLAGVGGMNFEAGFPPWGFWQVTLGIFGVTLLTLAVAWAQDWV